MQRVILACALALSVTGLRAADSFTRSVSPQEFSAAGLDRLTPEQLAQLDRLVQKYATPAPVTSPASRPGAPTTKAQRGDAVSSETEAVIKETERQTLLARAKRLLLPKPAQEIVLEETTIAGKFRGWDPGHIFVLANGERWRLTDSDRYFTPAIESPRVQLLPSSFGGCWLRFPDLNVQIRVQYVDGGKP